MFFFSGSAAAAAPQSRRCSVMLMFPPFCFSALLSKLAPLPLLFNSTTVETGPARLHQCHQTQNQKHAGLPPAASVWSAALLWESQRRDFILRTARPMRSRLIQVSLHQRGTHSSQRPTSLRGRSVFLCMERLFLLTAPPLPAAPPPPTHHPEQRALYGSVSGTGE